MVQIGRFWLLITITWSRKHFFVSSGKITRIINFYAIHISKFSRSHETTSFWKKYDKTLFSKKKKFYFLRFPHQTKHIIKRIANNGIATQNAMYQSKKKNTKEYKDIIAKTILLSCNITLIHLHQGDNKCKTSNSFRYLISRTKFLSSQRNQINKILL